MLHQYKTCFNHEPVHCQELNNIRVYWFQILFQLVSRYFSPLSFLVFSSFHLSLMHILVQSNLLEVAVEYVAFAVEFNPLAVKFVGIAVELVAVAVEFIMFAQEFVSTAITARNQLLFTK